MKIKKSKVPLETRWYILLFIVAVFGGSLRKWVVSSTGLSNAILGLQMIIPFLMVFWGSRTAVSAFSRVGFLTIYYAYLVFHVVNPMQLTIFHGLFGLLIHGGFWIGIFYYLANRSLFDPSRYMKFLFVACALEILLAFVQYALPNGHFLNKYAREGQSIAMVVDRVRVTGTFSYLSGYTAFLMFYILYVWAMIRMRFPQWLVLLAILMGIAAAFMTGSRSVVVILIVLAVPILIREYPITSLFKLLGRLFIPTMLLIALATIFNVANITSQVSKAYENFVSRVEANQRSGEQASRLTGDLNILQNNNFKYPIVGVGLGSTYQGAYQLFGTSIYVREAGYVESEASRLLLEGGWLIIIFRIILSIIMVRQLAITGFMRWAVWFVVTFGQPIVFNPHNAAFLLLGIILVDNIIWRQGLETQWRRRQIQLQSPLAADHPPLST